MGLFGPGKKTMRAYAAEKGLFVTEVARDMATTYPDGGGMKVDSIVKETCARYALQRGQRAGTRWTMILRGTDEGAQLPNGYLVQGDVTPELLKALTPAAEQFDTGFFEFESVAGEIACFWDEDGGNDEIDVIHGLLTSLQEL